MTLMRRVYDIFCEVPIYGLRRYTVTVTSVGDESKDRARAVEDVKRYTSNSMVVGVREVGLDRE